MSKVCYFLRCFTCLHDDVSTNLDWSGSKCSYDDEGEGDKIVARDRGRFATNAKWCNNGSWLVEDVKGGGVRFRNIAKLDNVPENSCLAWTDDWWCRRDDTSVGKLQRCQEGDDKQTWLYNEDTRQIKSKFDKSLCLEYGPGVGCAVGRSILLKPCGDSGKQKWTLEERTCSGDGAKRPWEN